MGSDYCRYFKSLQNEPSNMVIDRNICPKPKFKKTDKYAIYPFLSPYYLALLENILFFMLFL